MKVSYSCMNSMARIIKSHNSKLSPRHQCPAPDKGYNCRTKAECPLDGACREYNLVYQATLTNAKTQEAKIYIGMTEEEFKIRFNNHKTSFKHNKHSTKTALSLHIWDLKEKNINYSQNHGAAET